jgi:hypothetical protein
MMPGDYPLAIYKGDSYRFQFLIWLDAAKSQPVDLTDVMVKAEIRDKPAGQQIYALDCSIVLPNTIEAILTPLVSASLPVGSLVWDIQLTYPDGMVNTVLAGKVTVTQDVTDSFIPPVVPEARVMSTSQQQPKLRAVRAAPR